jgi:hypothetical protein
LKIAVICLAYLGPARGVEWLAHYFARSDADIWLHVDAATDAAEYQSLAARVTNLYMVQPRMRSWWGGFNGAVAVLAACETAQKAKNYDRFLYLTEDSVPLRRPEELRARLARHVEYIEMSHTDSSRVWARYKEFYCWDCDAMNPRCYDYQGWMVTPALERQVARLAQLRARGKAPLSRLWHGPCYWGLSATVLEELLARHRQDTWLRESFEFSSIPEEQYYHTILGESSRRFKKAPFMFMDFSRDPKPFVFRTRNELLALQAHPHLFARKVDIDSEEVSQFVAELAQ